MLNISLANQNPHSKDRHVVINVTAGLCTFEDKREIELKRLLRESDFSHRLLTEDVTQTSDHVYHYEYDDLDGLLYSPIFIYSTLIQSDKPLSCQFKINPSAVFQRVQFEHTIDLSIHSHQRAQERVSITQFEAMISQIMAYQFKFSEDYIIDEEFSIEGLPPFVDGDALYSCDANLVELLKAPHDFSRYELRYISPRIGFGVFSKAVIKKGDIISFYTGVKTPQLLGQKNYSFGSKLDCFKLALDARQQGNIARFINHAPSLKSKIDSSKVPLCGANIEAVYHYLHGLVMVVYIATDLICPEEQLLVDYGQQYFHSYPMFRFKTNGQLIDTNKKFFRSYSPQKINHLKIMASHGVKKAQIYVALRMLRIAAVVALFTAMLHCFF